MDREKLYGGLSTSLLKFVRHLILGNATLNPVHTGELKAHPCRLQNVSVEHNGLGRSLWYEQLLLVVSSTQFQKTLLHCALLVLLEQPRS